MRSFSVLMLAVFSLTLLTSALLLFLVQPMIGKMIQPYLGGTPAVWNACMVFFQALLLAGYAYSHATTAWIGARKQAVLHLVLIVAVGLFLVFSPITVNKNLIQQGNANPIPGLLAVLFLSVGLPFFVVSTTAPLLQKWFASTDHPSAADPYFLYGASNFGSMVALFAYPTEVERLVGLTDQTRYWAVGYGLLIVLVIACAALMWRSRPASARKVLVAGEGATGNLSESAAVPAIVGAKRTHVTRRDTVRRERASDRVRSENVGIRQGRRAPETQDLPAVLSDKVTAGRRLRWILLAAVPSSLMLGATTYITTDVAAIPLLWVLPLTLYLLSFIIVFAKVPIRAQQIAVFVLLVGTIGLLTFKVIPAYVPAIRVQELILWMVRLGALVALAFSIQLFTYRHGMGRLSRSLSCSAAPARMSNCPARPARTHCSGSCRRRSRCSGLRANTTQVEAVLP